MNKAMAFEASPSIPAKTGTVPVQTVTAGPPLRWGYLTPLTLRPATWSRKDGMSFPSRDPTELDAIRASVRCLESVRLTRELTVS